MRKIVTSTLILLFSIVTQTQAQEQSKSSLINEIKLDSSYIYGEATMSSAESAQELALGFLKTNIDLWFVEAQMAKNLREFDFNEIAQTAENIMIPRGAMFRSFVYIHLDQLGIDVGGNSRFDALGSGNTTSSEADPNSMLSEVELFERELAEIKNVTTLVDFLSAEKYIDRCSFGEIDRESIAKIAIDDAYLIIYNPSDNAVYSILSPRQEERKNILTGEADSTRNYPNSKGVWIIYQ